ncbi:hypothetical protein scyTo_0014827 [Scyliorhinus torazame]|uniref:Uncharacterized protein n=1 Tax=Scyliorhinus torazame TaxID=75743 RepID=A0A401NVI2_SCYTO|nr:hypothetical protein [Scyliorhinus torazame]
MGNSGSTQGPTEISFEDIFQTAKHYIEHCLDLPKVSKNIEQTILKIHDSKGQWSPDDIQTAWKHINKKRDKEHMKSCLIIMSQIRKRNENIQSTNYDREIKKQKGQMRAICEELNTHRPRSKHVEFIEQENARFKCKVHSLNLMKNGLRYEKNELLVENAGFKLEIANLLNTIREFKNRTSVERFNAREHLYDESHTPTNQQYVTCTETTPLRVSEITGAAPDFKQAASRKKKTNMSTNV